MRHAPILKKILPTLLLAVGFCFSLQTPAMACSTGHLGEALLHMAGTLIAGVCAAGVLFGLLTKLVAWLLDRREAE